MRRINPYSRTSVLGIGEVRAVTSTKRFNQSCERKRKTLTLTRQYFAEIREFSAHLYSNSFAVEVLIAV
jgi:hypothetical protein